MTIQVIADREEQRLASLVSCEILDTPPEPAFDAITSLAARLCNAPIAWVSLVDRERQWFKSTVGLCVKETPRNIAFCSIAIQSRDPLIIEDATIDPRTCDNPLVTSDPQIRFYAGVPLILNDGHAVGTLCVIGLEPRQLGIHELIGLRQLADQVVIHLELRRHHRKLLERTREAERLAQVMIRTGTMTSMGGWDVDLRTGDLTWSEQVYRIHEVDPSTRMTVTSAIDFYAPESRPVIRSLVDRATRHGTPWDAELQMITATGRPIWVRAMGEVERIAGRPVRLFGVLQDITKRKHNELALRESEERFRTLALNAPVGIYLTDPHGACHYVNEKWIELTGVSLSVVLGHGWSEALHPDDRANVHNAWQNFTDGHAPYEIEYRFMLTDGRIVWVMGRAVALRDVNGTITGYLGTIEDITLRKDAEAALARAATHDSLTDLPNRRQFLEVLTGAVQRARMDSDYRFAVLFLDFDRFKLVNDSLGHEAGDDLLCKIAARIDSVLTTPDLFDSPIATGIAARLGGDEFVIMLDHVRDGDEACEIAERLVVSFQEPFEIGGRLVVSTASIGVVAEAQNEATAECILSDADTAMYQAKTNGKSQWVSFDTAMGRSVQRRGELEQAIRTAIHEDQITVAYQPIVDLSSGTCYGVEMLARWIRPDGESVLPAEFIPIAEEAGLMIELGSAIFNTACRDFRRMLDQLGDAGPQMLHVNLSPLQFAFTDLPSNLFDTVRAHGLTPDRVALEVTESAVVGARTELGPSLDSLSAVGFRLAMDEFGTGFSSLARLVSSPFSAIKLDRSFVTTCSGSRELMALIQTIVSLGENLDMLSIAEGVESHEELVALQSIGCGYGQGHYLAAPMAFDELIDWMRSGALSSKMAA
jgi:diguanylate cyclase (GGDEF)-like protein/PAS domain S-box-containing protein